MDRGSLHKGSWRETAPCAADNGQDVTAVFTTGAAEKEATIYRGKPGQVGSPVTRDKLSPIIKRIG